MQFLDPKTFLLKSSLSRRLYSEFAAPQPIIDFHTHLDPVRFVTDEPFTDIVDLWVTADQYKWRAMRMNGVPEKTITGLSTDPADRFAAWAGTLGHLAGNPLFEWSHMELQRFFGIEEILTPTNAEEIRRRCNDRLKEPELRPRALLRQAGVEVFVTSDQWLDPLDNHRKALAEETQPRMLPSLRADEALAVDSPGFPKWLEKLAAHTGREIVSLTDFQEALRHRLEEFAEAGCCISDHGIDQLFYEECPPDRAADLFAEVTAGKPLGGPKAAALKTHLLTFLSNQYAKRRWTLQLHVGAQRQTSRRLAKAAGKAGGYACIGSTLDIAILARLLDALEQQGGLPRTIIYPLNPGDYEMIASLCGSFVEDGMPGKLQLGPAWWYNDHRTGIQRHLAALANHALLGRFIGMTTDSRSFLSSVRHEYFRRVLCDQLGEWVEIGQLPNDPDWLGRLIRAVCHDNAAGFLLEKSRASR